jgi:phosphohistidine phosphatase
MTLKLILIRHAKSSWDDPFCDDHARVLNDRGRGAAPVMGRWLADRGHLPDVVLCSDAVRTTETLALMLPLWPVTPEVRILHSLYHAAPFTLLDTVQGMTAATVALVGHNPGIGGLACGLVKGRPDHPRFAEFPTCATAVLGFAAARWSEVIPGAGQVLDFAIPADLST